MNNYEKINQRFGKFEGALEAKRFDGNLMRLEHHEHAYIEHAGRCHFTLQVVAPGGRVLRTWWFHEESGLVPETPVDVERLAVAFGR